jgi:integrase
MARPRTTNKHLPKYVTVIHGSYWWRSPKQKAERICAVGDEAGMYRWVAEKLGPKPVTPTSTLNDCFDRYERDVIPTLEPRTQKDYRRHLVILRKTFGHMSPGDVKPRHIGQFLDVSKGRIQRNRVVAVLSAVYTKAVGRWYVADSNPCTKVERNKSQSRDRNVTDAEFAGMYACCGPKLQVAMDLALLTGQRQGTLLKLKWSQVTPEGVRIQQANKGGKKGKRLLIEMSPALQAVLERARAFLPHLPREYVLRTRKGRPFTQNGFRACWQRSMAKYVKQGGKRFTFHDLRAKSASDSETIQAAYERLGHTSMAMTRGVYDRGERKVKPLR